MLNNTFKSVKILALILVLLILFRLLSNFYHSSLILQLLWLKDIRPRVVAPKKVSQLSIPFRLNELNRQKFLLNHSLIFHGVKQYFLKALNFGSHFISFHFVSFYYQILSFKSDIAVTLAKRHSADSRGTKKISQLSISPKTQISKLGKPF